MYIFASSEVSPQNEAMYNVREDLDEGVAEL